MATTINQAGPGPWYHRSWQALQQLDFISWFFSWAFMLLSRLAEPLMTLSVLYVVIEAGIPQWAVPALHNAALAVMIAAPEVILPGAFVVAAQEKSRQSDKANLLFAVCWVFIVLTVITLASLFVLHLAGLQLSILMCCRCAVGVGYSVLIRVITHSGRGEQALAPAPVAPAQAPAIDTAAIVADITAQVTAQFEQRITDLQRTLSEQVQEHAKALAIAAAQPQSPVARQSVVPATKRTRPCLVTGNGAKERIRQLLKEQPGISSRKAGPLCGISHTQANTYIKEIKQEQESEVA